MALNRKKLRKKNLAAFKKYALATYNRLIVHRPASTLVVADDGELDVIAGGRSLYDGKAVRSAMKQIEDFWKFPTFISEFTAPQAGRLDRYGNPFLAKLLRRAGEDGVTFGADPTTREAFFLIVFGIGLGQHVDRLIKEIRPHVVLFYESDLDLFCHSLEVCPWHEILDNLRKRCGYAYFVTHAAPDPALYALEIINLLRAHNPPGIDRSFIFTHSHTALSKGVVSDLKKNADNLFHGIGFFYDESLMLKNSYMNLRGGKSRVFVRSPKIRSESSAFVVGSGPSLDDSFALIRDNADKAVIISGGSSLRPLLVNGITPDFHVETENLNLYTAINQAARDFDLSSICLVGSTTIDPSIIPYFDKTIFFFRNSLSPFPLFCDSDVYSLSRPNPAVINAMLSFAIDGGIEDIYFIGTDFGTKGTGRHHSKDNIHYTDESYVEDRRKYEIPVAGNFGGTVYTSEDFKTVLYSIFGTVASDGKGHRFFNCSDGAVIEGATAVLGSRVSLQAPPGGKKSLIGAIDDGAAAMTEKWFGDCWRDDRLKLTINRLADGFLELLADASVFRDGRYLAQYMKLVRGDPLAQSQGPSAETAVAILFRGTLDLILATVAYYLNRITDPAMREPLGRIARQELAESMEILRRDALAIVDDPTDIPPPLTSREWAKPIAEKPHSFGQVARNAPCPCGSGKRFKHCHGRN